ncbi:MAG: hypothetical protein R3D30_10250 [Hyphomicrobiales bacterium]
MFYQALAGAWPFGLDVADHEALTALADRMAAFMLKSHQGSEGQNKLDGPDEAYEQAVEPFVRGALDPAKAAPFSKTSARHKAHCKWPWRTQFAIADLDQADRAGRTGCLSRRRALGFEPGRPRQ